MEHSSGGGTKPSRAELRRLHAEELQRAQESRQRLARHREARDSFLQSQLKSGEVVVARSGDHPMVTDHRIISARLLHLPSTPEWVCDSLEFSQIEGWAPGSQHDRRPLVRLHHEAVSRIRHVPAHHVLRFRWGNAERPVTETETLLPFARATDPVLVALIAALDVAQVPRGEPFVIRPAGTREERTAGIHVPLVKIDP